VSTIAYAENTRLPLEVDPTAKCEPMPLAEVDGDFLVVIQRNDQSDGSAAITMGTQQPADLICGRSIGKPDRHPSGSSFHPAVGNRMVESLNAIRHHLDDIAIQTHFTFDQERLIPLEKVARRATRRKA